MEASNYSTPSVGDETRLRTVADEDANFESSADIADSPRTETRPRHRNVAGWHPRGRGFTVQARSGP